MEFMPHENITLWELGPLSEFKESRLFGHCARYKLYAHGGCVRRLDGENWHTLKVHRIDA